MNRHLVYAAGAMAFLLGLVGRATLAENPRSDGDPLERLRAGNARYVSGAATHPNQSVERRGELAQGQKPFAVVLACADSRVAPEIIFDQGLGDLFVVRVAGNVVDNATLGSLEYAVEHLGVSLLVVLGHEKCGAVSAAVSGGKAEGHLFSIVQALEPAVKESRAQPGDPIENAVAANVRHVSQQLQDAEPVLRESCKAGRLRVIGARYDLDTGTVTYSP